MYVSPVYVSPVYHRCITGVCMYACMYRCIAEVMGSNPVQAWIFFRPYFHYCLSSAHYCEDHFHSPLYPQFKYMTFIYSISRFERKILNNRFIRQLAFIKIWSTCEVWRARKIPKGCSSNFPSGSYLNEHTADVRTNCFITFSTRWKSFFSSDLFVDVMSVHNRNTKRAHAIEFD